MASAVAQALGLGPVSGDLPFGKPLRVEVPLIGTAGAVPAAECFSVVPVAGNIDDDYFPRGARIHVDAMGRGAKLVITTQNIIRQPIIEFRLSAGCTYGIARDYLLMVAAPVASPAQAPTLPEPPKVSRDSLPRSPAPVAEAAPAIVAKGLPDGIAGIELVLDGDTTLDQLARQHYPGPLRRERFARWVREANPRLFGAGDASSQRLAAGTRLIIPATVPPRRPGDHAKAEEKVASSQAPATEARVPPPAKKKEVLAEEAAAKPGAAKGANDRLILGGGGSAKPPSLKEAVAMIDRLTGLLEQQVASQTEMAERLQKLEAGMAEMSKYVVQLETLSRQREAQWKEERRKEREEAKKREQDGLVHLLLAVLGGGVVGAGLLGVFHRLASRSNRPPEFVSPAPPAAEMGAVFAAAPVAPSPSTAPAPIPAPMVAAKVTPVASPVAVVHPEAPKEEAKSFTETQPIVPLSQVLDPVPPRPNHEPMAFSYDAPVAPASTAPAPAPALDHPVHEVLHSGRDDAIELVDIMASMGLVQGAAQALVEHIKEDPRKSLHYWLKLLDIYRGSGMKEDYEKSASELRHTFNVQAPGWAAAPVSSLCQSVEDYPHIASRLQQTWGDAAACHAYLSELLFDHREGTREGFPQKVAEEILLLLAITSDQD